MSGEIKIFKHILLMTNIERNLTYGQYSSLVANIWDLIGCDYTGNLETVNSIVEEGKSVEEAIPDLQYIFHCKNLYEHNKDDIHEYLIDQGYGITDIESIDEEDIVQLIHYIVEVMVNEVIKPVIEETLQQPLEESNYYNN